MAGKNWLESREPPEHPLITENFPETPKNPNPVFIDHKPVIPNENPPVEDNCLSTPKTLKKSPEILTNEIPPISQEKFLLNNPSKKSDQLKISQPLALIVNSEEKSAKKEEILLAKIKLLEEQLKQTKTERNNLKTEKEKAEALVQAEKQRANNYQQQLKIIVRTLKQ